MTKEEAIDILQEDIAINKHLIDTLPSAAAETFKNDILTYNMAIKSLEAWEKVKEEIESNMVSLDGLYSYQKSFHNNCNNVRKECIEIIDKHLSEVSE